MKFLIAALMILVTLPSSAGELADLFQSAGESDIVVDDSRSMPADHGITEIGIERTVCFGTCPIYTFVVKSDGTVRYVGEAYVDHIGVRTGKISAWQFNGLATFISESDFMSLHRGYTANITDLPTVYTMVVANGERKVVSNYANAGPGFLWAIEQLIDSMKTDVVWDE